MRTIADISSFEALMNASLCGTIYNSKQNTVIWKPFSVSNRKKNRKSPRAQIDYSKLDYSKLDHGQIANVLWQDPRFKETIVKTIKQNNKPGFLTTLKNAAINAVMRGIISGTIFTVIVWGINACQNNKNLVDTTQDGNMYRTAVVEAGDFIRQNPNNLVSSVYHAFAVRTAGQLVDKGQEISDIQAQLQKADSPEEAADLEKQKNVAQAEYKVIKTKLGAAKMINGLCQKVSSLFGSSPQNK